VGLGAQGGSSTKGEPKFTTGGGPDLAHDNTVDDLAQNGDIALLDPQGPVEDRLFDCPPLVYLGHNALSDRFPDGGDADHDRRSKLAEIALAVPHGSVGQRLDPAVSKGYANREKDELDNVFHDVSKGQEREEGVIGFELMSEEFVHSSKDGHEVGVSDDDSLGVSSGSAGVHDAVYVICLWCARLCFLFRDCDAFSAFSKFLDSEDGDVRADILDPLEEFRLGLPVVNHEFDGGGVGEDVRKDREEIGVGEHTDTLWLVEGVCEAGFTKSVICGRDGRRERSAGKGHELPVDAKLNTREDENRGT